MRGSSRGSAHEEVVRGLQDIAQQPRRSLHRGRRPRATAAAAMANSLVRDAGRAQSRSALAIVLKHTPRERSKCSWECNPPPGHIVNGWREAEPVGL